MDEIREKFGHMPDAEREELKRRIAELESQLETEYERGRKEQREARRRTVRGGKLAAHDRR